MISPIEPLLMQPLGVSGTFKIVIPSWWRPIFPNTIFLSHSWSHLESHFYLFSSPPYTLLTSINQYGRFDSSKQQISLSTKFNYYGIHASLFHDSIRKSLHVGKEYWFLKLHVNHILCQSLWSCLPHCFSRYMLPAAENRPRAANAIIVEFSMFRW